jgi:hypothetical protein
LLEDYEEASSIYLDIQLKYHQVEGLKHFIEDHRPIPTYKDGDKIKVPVIQWYFSRKIEDWVALGGERALEKGQFLAGIYRNRKFKRDLYWDLCQDLETSEQKQYQL